MLMHLFLLGSLQIWYQLHKEKRPEVFSPILSSLADGRLHRVHIQREGKDVFVQVLYSTAYVMKHALVSKCRNAKNFA